MKQSFQSKYVCYLTLAAIGSTGYAQQPVITQQQMGHHAVVKSDRAVKHHTKQLKNRNVFLTKEPLSNPVYGNVVTLSLGASWADPSSVTSTLAPEIVNTYAANGSDAFVVGELFGGMEKQLSPGLVGQLGVALAIGGNADISGDILVNAQPGFDNYTYQYSVNRTYVGLKGKLLKDMDVINAQPYLSGSVGLGFNHSYKYSSAPKINTESPIAPFESNITETFSYAIGVGVEKSFATNWSAGIGYEFSDWGRSALGRVAEGTYSTNVERAHLYNNALLLNLSFHG